MGQDRDIGNVGGKRPLIRPRRKWDDIIEIDNKKWDVAYGLHRGGSG